MKDKTNFRIVEMDGIVDSVQLPYLRSGGCSIAKLVRLAKDALKAAGYTYEEYCDSVVARKAPFLTRIRLRTTLRS
jgi:hypothetical protein